MLDSPIVEVISEPRKARKSLKRAPMKRKPKKGTKTKTNTFAALRDFYGLPSNISSRKQLRYANPPERGILWYWFSRYVRARDKKYPCISCNLPKPERQGGHFIPTGSMGVDEMVFSEKNVHSECSSCNNWDKNKLQYARNLDIRYGLGTAQALRDIFYEYKYGGVVYRNWNVDTYKEKIAYYRNAALVLEETQK